MENETQTIIKPVERAMRCKVEVALVIPGNDEQGRKYNERIICNGVYSEDPNNENRAFWKATPSALIDLHVDNPEVWGLYKPGDQLYIDITIAERANRA
jgi:hypothetical protein